MLLSEASSFQFSILNVDKVLSDWSFSVQCTLYSKERELDAFFLISWHDLTLLWLISALQFLYKSFILVVKSFVVEGMGGIQSFHLCLATIILMDFRRS